MRASWRYAKETLGESIRAVEIGVERGRNALDVLKNMSGINLTLVDPYTGSEIKPPQSPEILEINRVYGPKWMLMPSLEAGMMVPDGWFDFVYIDGDHRYEEVVKDICMWLPKVRKGGILAGHDYSEPSIAGVKQAVDEWFKDKLVHFDDTVKDFQTDWWVEV